ncbi:MAG: carbohydrate ABC transporter permease [Anaerolineales bacterium]
MLDKIQRASFRGSNLLMSVPNGFFSVIMLAATMAWCLPLVGLIINAFRPYTAATSSGWWTVIINPQFTLENYKAALSHGEIYSGLLNSVLITIPTTILVVVIAAAAAFALIWTDLPGRRWIYIGIVALLVVPPEITLYPTLVILKALKLVNTFPGIWMSHVSAVMPFGVFLLGSFFSQIPRELFETAKVDGASSLHQLIHIALPLSGSALASLATFDFLWVWNDLLRALIIIPDPTIRPLTAVLANLAGGYGQYVTVMAAGATLLMIPPLIVFLVAQRAFVRGVLAGAIKS